MSPIGPGLLALLVLTLDTTASGRALADAAQAQSGLDVAIGLGAALMPDYEGSDDYEPTPVPNVRIGHLYAPNTYVLLRGTRIEASLLSARHLRIGVVGRYLSDYGDVEDDEVSQLAAPEEALQAGLLLGYDFAHNPRQRYILELEATYDVLHGNGGLITPRLRFQRQLTPRLTLAKAIAVTWASDDYLANRFSVGAADALRSGLATFDADAGFKDVSIDLAVTYLFTDAWSLTSIAGYRRLLDDAADSPIVDDQGDPNNFSIGAVVSYSF